jgi:NAD(P)-dependent dehydrogenase (short-subunit alcohol dehydrogenase family)
MTARFSDMIIVLSGATGGFGLRTAERLAAEGAMLVLTDRMDDPGDAFRLLPAQCWTYVGGDAAEETTAMRVVESAISTHGRLDIAINNAGIAQNLAKLHRVPSEEARKIIDIDLMGVFHAMSQQLRVMEQQNRRDGTGGSIVNIASVAGLGAAPRLSVYAAAKHGVIGLTKSAAIEYAGRNIRVNAICPSYARTPMVEAMLDGYSDEERLEAETELVRGIPMRRLADVDEVVEAILFAAAPANSFMTGQAIAIDGGLGAL